MSIAANAGSMGMQEFGSNIGEVHRTEEAANESTGATERSA
jgi:hypothetical protein